MRKKERRIRRWECRKQRDEEYRLRDLQGHFPPAASEYSSSSEEEEESNGGRAPPRGGILRPLTESRRGGRGASARGRRGSARRRAVCARDGARHGDTSACRGSVQERCSGNAGRHHIVRRELEEEEAGLLHLEVSNCPSSRSGFEGLELKLLFRCSQGVADRPRPRAC
jgi:hypothetical protein